MKMMKRKVFQSGQVLLVVLLIMLVGLTIGLSVISRSIIDIKISREAEESARAFSAAEAGIEEVLKMSWSELATLEPGQVTLGDEVTATYKVSPIKSFEATLEKDETGEILLEGGSFPLSLEINWVKPEEDPETCREGSAPASLELIFLKRSGVDYLIERHAYNSCDDLSTINNFASAEPGDDGFISKVTIENLTTDYKILRIRPIYNRATVRVTATEGELPVQSYRIRSEGEGPGGETRVIEVIRGRPALPPIFDYALFSGGNLAK